MAKKVKVPTKKAKEVKAESKKERKITKPVTRATFCKALARETGCSVAGATTMYNAFFGLIRNYMKDGRLVMVRHFGSFRTADRGERPGFNPIAKKKIVVKACKVIKFRPSGELKKLVNGKE